MEAAYRLTRRYALQGAGVAGLGLLAGCGRLPGRTESAAPVYRIAYLAGGSPNPANTNFQAAFREGLRDFGFVEGQNIVIEQRYTDGDDRLAGPAAELVRLQPRVIVVPSGTVASAVRAATTTIPVVNAGSNDLVAIGLAASLARPGGNVTGLSTPSLVGKQLQLLQEAVSTLSRVAILFDTTIPEFRREPYQAASRVLGLQMQFVGASSVEDLDLAFVTAIREHADGLFLPIGPVLTRNLTRIAELAIQNGLPSMWQNSEAGSHGGLMAYGPNRAALYRRAAYYVARILEGTSPADLPIEQPREFDFVINLRTAQALGLTVPQHVLLQATEIIQ
jgi:putative ABC transport system substrate-binding protein